MAPRHNLSFCVCKRATLGPELHISIGPRPHLQFCAFKIATLGPEFYVSMGPSPHLWFMHAKQRFWTRITSLSGYHTSPVIVCMQNSVISTRITCLYGSQPSSVIFGCKTARITNLYWSQTSPVVLFPQNGAISTCITSIYGSLPSSMVFACKTWTFGPELQVSMGPRPHLSFCAHIKACLAQEYQDYMGSRPHLWFFHAKQRLLEQNNKSLWVPDMTCRFVHVQQRG